MLSNHRSEVPAMNLLHTLRQTSLDRRSFLTKALGAAGASTVGALQLAAADAATKPGVVDDYLKEIEENERKLRSKDAKPMIGVSDKLKITKVETFMVKPRWLFLKIHKIGRASCRERV